MAKQPRILAGETAAITGAARGIGRATAQALLGQGMKVAIGDVDVDAARQTAAELGPSAVALPLDVTDRESFSGLPRRGRAAARPARRARQQRRDHADRALHRRGRPDGAADGRHQPPRRDPRHEARARADDPARPRPHRQHLLAGRQVRRARRRDLLGDQARRRRPDRGGARRAAPDGRAHRPQLRDALRRQHRARLAASARRAASATSSRPKSPTRSSRRCSSAPSKCGCRSPAKRTNVLGTVLPRRLSEGMARAMKADRVLADADTISRRAYELRAVALGARPRGRRPSRRRSPARSASAAGCRLARRRRPSRQSASRRSGRRSAGPGPPAGSGSRPRSAAAPGRRSPRRSARRRVGGRIGSESAHSISVGRRSSRSASCTRWPAAAPGASGERGIISGKARAPAFEAASG